MITTILFPSYTHFWCVNLFSKARSVRLQWRQGQQFQGRGVTTRSWRGGARGGPGDNCRAGEICWKAGIFHHDLTPHIWLIYGYYMINDG